MKSNKESNILEILTPEQANDLDDKIEKFKKGREKSFSVNEVFKNASLKFGIRTDKSSWIKPTK